MQKKFFLALLFLQAGFVMASNKLHCEANRSLHGNNLDGGIFIEVEKMPDGRVFIDVLGRRQMTVTDEFYSYTEFDENQTSLNFLFQLNRYSLEMDFGVRTNSGQWLDLSGHCKAVASEPKI